MHKTISKLIIPVISYCVIYLFLLQPLQPYIGFGFSSPDHSRLFYLWRSGSRFSFSASLNHLSSSSLHLFFGRSSVLISIGFQTVAFLASLTSSILFRCLHHFILRPCIYLTIFSFINFRSSLSFLTLHLARYNVRHYFSKYFVNHIHKCAK